MFQNMSTIQIIQVFLPLIIIELILKVICIKIIIQNDVKYFPKYIWIIIVLFISTLGPLSFLIFGRKIEK